MSLYPTQSSAYAGSGYPPQYPIVNPSSSSSDTQSMMPTLPVAPLDTLELSTEATEPKKKKKKKVAVSKNGWLLPVGLSVGLLAVTGVTLFALREHPKVKPLLEKITGKAKKAEEPPSPSGSAKQTKSSGSVGGGNPPLGGSTAHQWTPEEMTEAQQWFEEASSLSILQEVEAKLKMAAERNHLDALCALGIIQYKQTGKTKEALLTFEKGANEGIIESQTRLANLLLEGIGQPSSEPNYKQAYFWAYIAKENDPSILNKINATNDALKILTNELKAKIETLAEQQKLTIAEKIKNHPTIPPPPTA